MDIIEKIISNFKNNKSLYIGENVTIAEHMIQSAMVAEKTKSKDNLICSCLLHDYGHFIVDDPDELVKIILLRKFILRIFKNIDDNSIIIIVKYKYTNGFCLKFPIYFGLFINKI